MTQKPLVFEIEQGLRVDDVDNLILWIKQMVETAEIEKNNTTLKKYRITIRELR